MPADYFYRGTVPMKEGVTWTQIRALWLKIDGDEPEAELPFEADGYFQNDDGLYIELSAGDLSYHMDGYCSLGFGDRMDEFLDTIAKDYAISAWTGEEGEEREPIIRGPSERAIAWERLENARNALNVAAEEVRRAEKELASLP